MKNNKLKNILANNNIGNISGGLRVGDDIININSNQEIKKHLLTPPADTEVFLGRDNELEELHNILFNSQDHVLLLVNGQGGIGKTTLASKYYHRYQEKYHHLAWVLADKSILDAILRLADSLNIQFNEQEKQDSQKQLDKTLQIMAGLDKPCLLILDNANDLEDLEKYHPKLRTCSNFHVLLTTRVESLAHKTKFYKVNALSKEESLILFKQYYLEHKDEENDLVFKIYDAVEGNTLVLEVLAKNLQNLNSKSEKYSLSTLLMDIKEKGLLDIQQHGAKKVTVEWHSWEIQNTTPENILSGIYELSGLEESEKHILSIFAVLPPENIPYQYLVDLLQPQDEEKLERVNEEKFETVLDSLAQKGWLGYDSKSKSYRISPIIQQIVINKNEKRILEDCIFIVAGLSKKLHHNEGMHYKNYKLASIYNNYAENIMRCLKRLLNKEQNEQLVTSIGILIDAIIKFYNINGNSQKMLKDLEDFEQYLIPLDDLHLLSLCYQNMGNIYIEIGDMERALIYFKKSKKIAKRLLKLYPNNIECEIILSISYQNLGEVYGKTKKYELAIRNCEKRHQLTLKLYQNDINNVKYAEDLGWSFQYLGLVNFSKKNLGRALSNYKGMNKIFEKIYIKYPENPSYKNGLALSHQFLGEILHHLGNFELAKKHYEIFYTMQKELLETHYDNAYFNINFAWSLQFLGDLYIDLKEYDEALKCYTNMHEMFFRLYDKNKSNNVFSHGLGVSYYKLGFTFYVQGSKENAEFNLNEAKKILEELEKNSVINEFQSVLDEVRRMLNNGIFNK